MKHSATVTTLKALSSNLNILLSTCECGTTVVHVDLLTLDDVVQLIKFQTKQHKKTLVKILYLRNNIFIACCSVSKCFWPVQPPESLPHPDRILSPVIFGLKEFAIKCFDTTFL